jgi:hypothetical protein
MALPRKLKSTDNAVEIIVMIPHFTAQGQQWEGGQPLVLQGG